MLVSIRRRDAAPEEGGPVTLLLECHRRIRHFTSLAGAIAAGAGADRVEIAAAAAGVHRYFTEALPLHSADEDRSIAPRLIAVDPSARVREALASMTAQHGELERTLADSIPRWAAIAADPACLSGHAAELGRLQTRLVAQWDEHLGLEEDIVFPAIRDLLPEPDRAAILREMRARRGAPEA